MTTRGEFDESFATRPGHLRVRGEPAPGGGAALKIAGDVRKYAAEQGIAEEEALKKGREEKPRVFTEKGSELYAKG